MARRYTPTELQSIVKSIELHELDFRNIERLQKAVEAYQWGSLEDDKIFPASTNKGRRNQLELIVRLCERGAPESDIKNALDDLDGSASQLLGPVGLIDHFKLKEAVESALAKIPKRGPDPKRGRRQFICDLARIFLRITNKRPGRSVFDQEQGDFFGFVKASLEPFQATQGCEADIKAALTQMKRGKDEKLAK